MSYPIEESLYRDDSLGAGNPLSFVYAEMLASIGLFHDASAVNENNPTSHDEPFGPNGVPSSMNETRLAAELLGTVPIQLQDPSNEQDGHYAPQSATSSSQHTAAPDISTIPFIASPTRHKFKCSGCGRQFARSGRAEACENSHTGAKPYACKGDCGNINCAAKFASKASLKRHCRPEGKRQSQCGNCGASLLRQNAARHRRVCEQG